MEYKDLNADYSVHYDTSSIVFYTAPEENDIVTIYSIGVNVSNVLDIGYYVGTYTTTNTISTKTMWKDGITGVAYISGQIISNTLVFDAAKNPSTTVVFRIKNSSGTTLKGINARIELA